MNIKNKLKNKKGFTLMELLVVLAIMALVLTALFAGYSRFGVRLNLQNLAFNIAAVIREAQIFGSYGKYQNFNEFAAIPVGIKLEASTNRAGSRIVLFIDRNNNKRLDTQEEIQISKFTADYNISDIFLKNNTNKVRVNDAYIFFVRPSQDAKIYNVSGVRFNEVEIVVSSPFNDKLSVVVNAAGQLSVIKSNN